MTAIYNECTKCSDYGMQFKRGYQPVDFIEGKTNSIVWIVGLNPAADQDWVDVRTIKELKEYFADLGVVHSYFKDFKSVSKTIFENFGVEYGTAHTDIVKCSSKSFPPESAKGKKATIVINNCKSFLEQQIKMYKPKIIVCNGAEVSKFMLTFLPPTGDFNKAQTSYWSTLEGAEICVVLSGFIGRIDNYAKRRLGVEIESRLQEVKSLNI